MNLKVKVAAEFVGLVLAFYVFFKYIFILIWPLAVSASLALLLYPLIRFIHNKLKIKKILVTIVILAAVLSAAGFMCFLILKKIIEQINLFIANFDYYQNLCNQIVIKVCCETENLFGARRGCILEVVNEEINGMLNGMQSKMVNYVIGGSLPAVKTIADMIIGIVLVIVAFFLIVKDMEQMKEKMKNSVFGRELEFIYDRVKIVFKAYVKAQIIIMSIVAALSVAGLSLAGFDYAWIVGLAVGVLDALPLFGAGIVLVPITFYYLFTGNMLKAAIIFITFIACYFGREYLEPKLMGDKMGVGALTMLVGIYVGYQLFGFLGMFAGAFSVIFITDILKRRRVEEETM